MSRDFEELDYRETTLGELILRRRRILSLGGMEVYEVRLGDAFLMSSLFHKVEVTLAHLGLAELESAPWDVVIRGSASAPRWWRRSSIAATHGIRFRRALERVRLRSEFGVAAVFLPLRNKIFRSLRESMMIAACSGIAYFAHA
jgi:hypothetical protein